MVKTKILIVEDEAIIAQHIEDILEENGYAVVGVAHNMEKAIRLINFRSPDLIILDITLSDESTGIDLAHYINKHSRTPFIYLTSYSDSETVKAVINTNPVGYIAKPFKEKDLLPAIQLALAKKKKEGNLNLPEVNKINSCLKTNLSTQEHLVLTEIWKGKKNIEIAEELFLSNNTIKTHIRRLFEKLDVNSRVSAIKKVLNCL